MKYLYSVAFQKPSGENVMWNTVATDWKTAISNAEKGLNVEDGDTATLIGINRGQQIHG